MKLKLLICIFTAISCIAKSQNFPSVDEAFLKAQGVNYDKEFLEKFGFKTSECKLLKQTLKDIDDNGIVKFEKPEFTNQISDKSKRMYPLTSVIDECVVGFTYETPKKDGYYHLISVAVVYTKFKGDVLTNTWNFKWVNTESAFPVGSKNIDPKIAEKLLVDILKTKKPKEINANYYGENTPNINWNTMHMCYRINEIKFVKAKMEADNEEKYFYKLNADIEKMDAPYLLLADGESIDYFEDKPTYSIKNINIAAIDYDVVLIIQKTNGKEIITNILVDPVTDVNMEVKYGSIKKVGKTLSFEETTFDDVYKKFSAQYNKEEKN